jgi:hypothetical protein
MTVSILKCVHCETDNSVAQCSKCGRNFVVTTEHLAGKLRDFDAGPVANPDAPPPATCDFCGYQTLGDPMATVSAGLRQRTCPACHTEFLSAHGL